jgi:nucleotide-binding universal stress UspA family protein
MSPIKIILVATDFSEHSERALAFAVDLAEEVGARIYLLHAFTVPVVGPPAGSGLTLSDLSGRIVHGAQDGLEKAIAATKNRDVEICPLLKEGDPRIVIPTTAEDLRADLLVVGTHGRQGVARALIGSVAESVVRTAEIPVVTMRARGAE